jgi:phosphoribosylanthranilate isomerase
MPAVDLARIVEDVGLDAVQLHGDEAVALYEHLRCPLIKSVALADDDAVLAALSLPKPVTPLVDAGDHQRRGGTGRTADWGRAAVLARQRPIMLAGGLTPENVADAVRQIRPWAVDVSSGVEASPGVKNADRLRRFFAGVRAAESEAE